MANDTQNTTVRLVPFDNDAEMAVLGAMLQWREAIPVILSIIPPHRADMFLDEAHRKVFGLAVEMWERNEPIDLISFKYRAMECGIFVDRDPVEYLMELAASVVSCANAEHHARIVRDVAWRREAIVTAQKIDSIAFQGDAGEVGHARESIERLACKLIDRQPEGIKEQTMAELTAEAMADIMSRQGQGIDGLATGMTQLDDLLCGLHRQEMILLAARPSQGKTALGLQIAAYIAGSVPVAFVSLEMGRKALVQRLLCSEASVDSQLVRRGMLSAADLERLDMAQDRIAALSMMLDDTRGISLADIRSKGRLWRERDRAELIVVDYLQLMRTYGKVESRQQEVAGYSAGLKALAGELNIPILVLCQLNRNPEGRNDFRPRMSDLRESGSLEQDADVVLLLHRPEYYFRPPLNDDQDCQCGQKPKGAITIQRYADCCKGKAEIIVAKNRNGPVGMATVHFNPQYTRFGNYARTDSYPEYTPYSDYCEQGPDATAPDVLSSAAPF